MSTATEIEKAILSLPSDELEKLAGRWETFRTINSDPEEKGTLSCNRSYIGLSYGRPKR